MEFLRQDVEVAHASVFSRRAYVWDRLERRKVAVIPPCIDPTSPKNVELAAPEATRILQAARIVAGETPRPLGLPIDGTGTITIRHVAERVEEEAVRRTDPSWPRSPDGID